MAAPSWFWPPSGMAARGNALVPYGAGMAVPDWVTPSVWPFVSAFGPPVVLATGTPGLSGATAAPSGGIWAVGWTGPLWEIPPIGSGAPTAHALTSGEIYLDCAYSPAASAAYALNTTGAVRDATNTLIGTFSSPGIGLVASGTTLFAPLATTGASGAIGTMLVPAGTSGQIALPAQITTPSCLFVASGQPLLVGGWTVAAPLSGAVAAALNPADPTRMLGVGISTAILWLATRGTEADAWSQGQVLSGGVDSLNSVAWLPDGTQALTTSVVSGAMQVFNYTAGVLSLTQSLAVSGANSVAVGDATHALVVQSGATQVATVSASLGVWVSGVAATGLTGVSVATAYGTSGVAVNYSGGIALFALNDAGNWIPPVMVPLGFAPTLLTADPFGQVYAAASGHLSVVSGTTVVGSGALPAGTPTGLAVQQGRVCVAMPSASATYVMGLTAPGLWTQMGSGSLGLGSTVGLALSQTTLFSMGSGSTVTQGFSGTPYDLTPVLAGAVGQWNGAAWTTTIMGPGYTPAAVTFDTSGNAWVITTQNDLWSISSSGTVLTSGIASQQPGQPQNVPLGSSALLASGGQMFAATSVAGMLVEAA